MSDIIDLLPGIRDQGVRPTCLSMALSDGHHAARASGPPLAADYLHFHAVAIDGKRVNDGATSFGGVVALATHGQPPETDCPYSAAPRPNNWKPSAPPGDVWRRRATIVDGDLWAEATRRLSAGEPLVLVLNIDDAFYDAVGNMVDEPVGPVRSRHAVLAIRTDGHRLLVRNSWGTDWADEGYAWITEDYVAARCNMVITLEGATT